MKSNHFFLCIIFSLYTLAGLAQNVSSEFTGYWKGTLNVLETPPIGIILQISPGTNHPHIKLSTSRGLSNFVVPRVITSKNHLSFTIKAYAASYSGMLSQNQQNIQGTWQQAGQKLPLSFKKISASNAFFTRKQNPQSPFPYHVKEVNYTNYTDKVTLAGTLTIPKKNTKKKIPALILLTVAGPNDRNQSFAGHQPYAVVADYFSRRGLAVLRSDDRGVGQSQGNLFQSTMANFAKDTQAAIQFLQRHPQIDPDHIYLMGNSEGGAVAALTASLNPTIAGIVLLAAPGIEAQQIILKQGENLGKIMHYTPQQIAKIQQQGQQMFQIIMNEKSNQKARQKLHKLNEQYRDIPSLPNYFAKSEAEAIDIYLSPWYRYQLGFKPKRVLQKVTCPVLALNGSLDQVIMPQENLLAIYQALMQANNSDVTIRQIPGLNHIFQTAQTGSPLEYSQLTESFSPQALQIIYHWLTQHLD